VLEALLAVGITVGIVVALSAAIAEVKALLAGFGVFGVTGSLLYDVRTGRLGFVPSEGAHHTELHRRARAMQSPDWRKLENALQRLHRLDELGLDRLKASQPVPRTGARPPEAAPRHGSPPASDDGDEPPRRRIVKGFHGANGDAILSILRSGRIQPRRGAIWLNLGDHRASFQHGGDRKRGATFVAEIQVSFDPARVSEDRSPTPGIPLSLRLITTEAQAAAITRMFRRRRVAGKIVEDILHSAAAIEAALR
jgi:hypothetical protein